jgi:flagellar motility protein MotE (MotC chaperone)
MPEPRERADMEEQEFAPPPAKKKKSWKGMFFLLLLLTATGAAAGMHISGAWDARPLIYGTVPKIPWVGEDIARITGIPGEYSLTAEERRRLELQRWSERLDDRERTLRERDEELGRLAAELEARTLLVEKKETELELKQSKLPESPEEEKAYVDMLMRTYQEISPRRAALILEQLREDLAVKMLLAMPPDARASILGRMDAARAARLTERLAAGGSR